MASMTNLLVKDDTTVTPVEYTFLPVTDTPNPLWRTALVGVPLDGQMRFTLASAKQKNGSYKVTGKLEVPVMETLGASGTSFGYVAPPKVAYVDTAIITLFVDKRSTIANRADLLKMALGIANGASSTTATGVGSPTASGDAYKNSVLPVTLAFTNLILPS